MNYRMVKATELLKLTSLSIADIGSAVGYENQLHFSRAFKNIYGVSRGNGETSTNSLCFLLLCSKQFLQTAECNQHTENHQKNSHDKL